MKTQKQPPAAQLLISELIELRDFKALQMFKADLTRDVSKDFLHYQDREAYDMIEEFLNENNFHEKLKEL